MMRYFKKGDRDLAVENPFGMSLGDLMAGLLLIFVLLLSFAMLRLEGLIAENRSQLEMMDEREQIKKLLISRLLAELSRYEVEIDPQTGVIRIKEGILFDFNRYDLKPEGKDFLRRFIPKYAEILFSDQSVYSQIAQIIIERHTDNVGGYDYNLDLSLKRAQNVASHVFSKEFGSFTYYDQLRQLLSVNGRSLVEPCAENNTPEGRALNRRVEFKFRLKDWDKTPELGDKEFQHLLELPTNLKTGVKLLSHQQEGIAWLQELWRKKYPGGLLADDMGVGKTLQILSFLEWHHAQQSDKRPYLIIAPIAVLENWEVEHDKFFENSGIEFTILYGSKLQELKKLSSDTDEWDMRKRRGSLDVKKLQTTDLVLTTYETARDFQLDMGIVNWAVVVADEAQRIKTPGTLVTNALKALKAGFRIVSTGTPVENTLVDLWCITDFVAPGHLGSAKEFAKEYQSPLKEEMTDITALGESVRDRLGILFKRRLKEDILEGLPEKHIHISNCQVRMPLKQEEIYVNTLRLVQSNSSDLNSRKILQILHKLRLICDHPLLPDSQTMLLSVEDVVSQSAKLQATLGILKNVCDHGEKAILFTNLKKTQQMLSRVVRDTFSLDEVSIVNGEVPGGARSENTMKMTRQQTIDRFQSKPGFNVIVISPLAAGVGLNITEANHVIHFTRWWNPAREDQASDRVYRIGQERPVHIYLPMSVNPQFRTFDVILHDLIERKRSLSKGALFPTERMEVTPVEIIEALQEQPCEYVESALLTIDDIDLLESASFEAFIAAIFRKQGFSVILTPFISDKGVDVVALPKTKDGV